MGKEEGKVIRGSHIPKSSQDTGELCWGRLGVGRGGQLGHTSDLVVMEMVR